VIETSDIDLRATPVGERPAVVENALDRLPPGASLTFITENEPRGLSPRLAQERAEGYLVESRRIARRLWRVRITAREGDQQVRRHPLLRQLQGCAPFGALEDSVLEELVAAAISQTGKRGETLVPENAEWPYVGMVTEGIVARAKGGATERERILYAIFPSELFGVAEYFDRGFENARIVVFSKNARIVKFPWSVVDDVATRHPQLTKAMGIVIAQRLRLMNDTLLMQGSQPIIARIAGVLLPYATPERGLAPALPTLASVTQSQIAAAVGTVKEVAARAIAELEARGVLRRERGHIRYLDRHQLLELIREPS
jgi:CRP-like cAMP-binding protein